MGYHTEFNGHFTVTPPLNEAERTYLTKFAETRRMNRTKGSYFVGGTGFMGQGNDGDVLDHNRPPSDQPGLWCQWIPNEDGTKIEWDGAEKFYNSTEWIQYIIDNFLKPGALASKSGEEQFKDFTFDHVVSGVVECEGEERSDVWLLTVDENNVMGNRDLTRF